MLQKKAIVDVDRRLLSPAACPEFPGVN